MTQEFSLIEWLKAYKVSAGDSYESIADKANKHFKLDIYNANHVGSRMRAFDLSLPKTAKKGGDSTQRLHDLETTLTLVIAQQYEICSRLGIQIAPELAALVNKR